MIKTNPSYCTHGPPPRRSVISLIRKSSVVCVCLASVCLLTTNARADLTISDGAASFFWDTDATGNAGGANFVEPFGSSDLQYAERWYLRYNGQSYALADATTQIGSGNSASVIFSGIANVPLQFEGFDVEIRYTITDIGNQAHLHTSATVTNLSGDAVDVSLYNYFDYDVGGAGGNYSNTTVDGSGISIRAYNPNAGELTRTGIGASHFQVQAYNGLLVDLEAGNISDLADTGDTFGPGDFTGALQWDLSLAGGGAASVSGTVLGTTASVPEPSMVGVLAAMTAGLGFVGIRRRRNRKEVPAE